MGFFRFRKSFKVLPGVRLNLSKSGTSFSLGPRGSTLNVGGKNGPRATVGIPGTGLSYTQKIGEDVTPAAALESAPAPVARTGWERAFNIAGRVLAVVLQVVGYLFVIATVVIVALLAMGASRGGRKSRY